MRAFGLVWVWVCALFLAGCGSSQDDKDFYVRVTVEATYDGKPVSGSAVIMQPLILLPPEGNTVGEAISIDLGGGKNVYLPLGEREKLTRIFYPAINESFQPIINPQKQAMKSDKKKAALLKLPFGTKAQWQYKRNRPSSLGKYAFYPLIVGFKDKSIPSSAFMVDTEGASRLFGKTFKFKGLYLERVSPDTPLTKTLHTQLPWVDPAHKYWSSRRQDGIYNDSIEHFPKGLQYKKASLKQKLRRSHFSTEGFRK